MTPAKSETPATNTGAVITQPASADNKTAAVNSNQGADANTGVTAAKKTGEAKPKSPEESAAIAGQSTFNAKCGRCHGLKVAGDYSVERWANILAVMAPRANLTETERSNVFEYVKANAKK